MPEVTYDIFNFAGGLDQSVDEHLLKPNASANMYNYDVRRGSLKTIPVSDVFGNIPQLSGPIATLMVYHNAAGKSVLFVTTMDGTLHQYHDDTRTWEPMLLEYFADNPHMSWVNEKQDIRETLIFTNGVANVKEWDGTNLADLSLAAPKMGSIDVHYRRLWGTADPSYPHTVYHSAEKELSNWDMTDMQNADAVDITSGDGGRCQALITMFDQIGVFKTYSIHTIYGTVPGEYGQSLATKIPGLIAPRSIALCDKVVIFLTSEGLYLFDGTTATPIGAKMDTIFKAWATNDGSDNFDGDSNTFGADFRKKVHGFYHDGIYYLANPISGQVIELDVVRGIYWVRNRVVNDFCVVDDILVYADNDGYIRNYNGNAVSHENAFWETPESTMMAPTAIKRSLKLYMLAKGSGNLTFDFEFDGVNKSVVVPLTPETKMHRIRVKNKGRRMRFRVKNTDNSEFEVFNLSVLLDVDND